MKGKQMATKEEIKSWHRDKAVQDNIVETWLCVDCGVNTAPGFPTGPEIRIAFARGEEGVDLRLGRDTEIYDVKNSIWRQAGMRAWSGCLCVGCLEKRIGRRLRPKDFSPHDKKTWADAPCTERLLNRRGLARVTVQTKDGPKEIICDIDDAARIDGAFMEETVKLTDRPNLVFVPENDDLVLYVELDGKRIAKRFSGQNWISLVPGYTVRGSEPGADSSTLDIEYDPAKALPQ